MPLRYPNYSGVAQRHLPAGRQGAIGAIMKYTIYAIKSKKDKRVYVGFTDNLNRRLREHNSGFVKSTKGYKPWIVFYTEQTHLRSEARRREKYLKSGCGKEFLKSVRDNNIPG